MRLSSFRLFWVLGFVASAAVAQQVIPLYADLPPGSAPESYPEKQYFSQAWKAEVVSNVTKPTLTLYRPAAGTGNGSAVVICPGGGFMALSIKNEGTDVAQWLAARGVTAFVLRYRLAHTDEDATQEFMHMYGDKQKLQETIGKIVPLSIADGLAAVRYVKEHAADWKVSEDSVGIIGFSAGGTVAAGVGLRYSPEGRPSFVAPIYPAAAMFRNEAVPGDAPPMFLAAASDDNLGLAMDSVGLYEQWAGAHKSVELHMYAKGGHGFGMRKQGFPSDEWADRLADWLASQGWLKRGDRMQDAAAGQNSRQEPVQLR